MSKSDKIEDYKKDIREQLTYDPMDWDYFFDTVEELKLLIKPKRQASEECVPCKYFTSCKSKYSKAPKPCSTFKGAN